MEKGRRMWQWVGRQCGGVGRVDRLLLLLYGLTAADVVIYRKRSLIFLAVVEAELSLKFLI